jgi:hypothetical protein
LLLPYLRATVRVMDMVGVGGGVGPRDDKDAGAVGRLAVASGVRML